MAVTVEQPAPYAPPSAILELIERHRNRGLPPVVDADVLARAGVSESLIPRTLQALKILDLLTEDGRPSQVFEGLRLAPTSEYQQRLAEWLNGVYADALSYVDPTTDDEVAIRDAFRKYIPTGQQSRMVTLFMGLFIAAGVMPPKQKATPRKAVSNGQAIKPSPRVKPRITHTPTPAAHNEVKHHLSDGGGFPAALAGLLATLPAESQGWTQEQRDKFLTAFPVILDYSYPIIVAPTGQPDNFDALLQETATDQ